MGWEERRKENLVIDTHLEGERVKTQTCICMHFDRFGENHRDEVTMMSRGWVRVDKVQTARMRWRGRGEDWRGSGGGG